MNRSTGTCGDFGPSATWTALRRRAELLQRTRAFFDKRGFLEVETPLLSRDTVVDRHLEPLEVVVFADPAAPQQGETHYLQTSPEFAMKRLLAAGAGPIYTIAKAFRAGERGARHNVEFTMLEWYRPGDDMLSGMRLLAEYCEAMFGRGRVEFVSYRDAFRKYAEVDPFLAETAELAERASRCGAASIGDRDELLNLILAEAVEPRLGFSQPTILHGYPPSQAALARISQDEIPTAERFELYVDGLELANGYHELQCAADWRARAEETNRERESEGKRQLPVESRLLAAMEHGLPACAGVALGFDRLVMLSSGAASIDQVLTFPIERA